jgi:MFS family permease
LAAEAISAVGTRMTMLAIPWLVLVNTGDPVKVGLVSAAEMLPYVLSGVLAAPLQDRLGARGTALISDFGSILALAAIVLSRGNFAVLMVFAAVAGTLRAQADRSQTNLLKPLMDAAKTDYTRITSAYAGITRTAQLVGGALAGVAIAAFGAQGALVLDAATFAAAASLIIVFVPEVRVSEPSAEPYFTALRKGFQQFRKDRLVAEVTWLIAVNNIFIQAYTVIFVPVWIFQVFKSPVALGVVSGAYALGGVLGSFAFSRIAIYLRRYPSFVAGFLIGGAPGFVVLALSDNLVLVAVTTFIGGLAMSAVNPTFGALIYQRIPSEMLARVGGILAAIALGGLPLAGVAGGWLVERFGLADGGLIAGVLVFAVSLVPLMRRHLWIELNQAPLRKTKPVALLGPRLSLRYDSGEWTVSARQAGRIVASRQPVPAKMVLNGLEELNVPELRDAVASVLAQEENEIRERIADLRRKLP